MASFEQDLIVFEDDTLLIQYTFTDLQGTFDIDWGAYWAAWSYDDWTGYRTGSNNAAASPPSYADTPQPDLEKYTNWDVINAPPAHEGGSGVVLSSNGDVDVVNGETIVKIYIRQADFASSGGTGPNYLVEDTEYYTELVLSPNKEEGQSIVGATGKLFISSSIFSTANYRP